MAPTSTPQGPDSVSAAPNLPAGFADTFTSRYVDTGDLRLHAVTGGDGPPLLLILDSSWACPRQESNLRTRFRKPLLYPLSYGGAPTAR